MRAECVEGFTSSCARRTVDGSFDDPKPENALGLTSSPSAAPMPHIEVRNVSLVYDTPAGRVTAVDGVSFDIEQSQFLCLVGPSGCGKTTLLNIIAGFL